MKDYLKVVKEKLAKEEVKVTEQKKKELKLQSKI